MIICADDIGMAEDIDQAAMELAALGRISAVSCIVTGKPPPFTALRTCKNPLDIGLHLTLTDAAPLASLDQVRSLVEPNGQMPPFGRLLRRSLTGQIVADEVTREITAQYHRFVAWAGRPPAFLDSHLHVHQLPHISMGLLNFMAQLPEPQRPYMRNSHLAFTKLLTQRVSIAKGLAIGFLGERLKRRLVAARIRTNDGFAGIYDYRHYAAFSSFLERFTATITGATGIIMVHPGKAEPWRRAEYEGLLARADLTDKATRFPTSQQGSPESRT